MDRNMKRRTKFSPNNSKYLSSICLSVYLPVFLSICLSICLSVYLPVYLSVCPSICPPTCLSVHLSFCPSICLCVRLSVFLSTNPSICLSICLSVYLPVYLSVFLSTYQSICLSICLSVYLPIYLSIYLSFCLSVRPSVHLPVFLSICLSVHLFVCLSVCLSICLFVYQPINLSIYLSFCLPTRLSICLSVYLPIYLSIYLSFCLPTCLSVYLYVCPSVHLSTNLSIYLSVCLSIRLSVYLPVYLSVRPSICPPTCLSVDLPVCLSVRLSTRPSDCPSIYPSVCLPNSLPTYLPYQTPPIHPSIYLSSVNGEHSLREDTTMKDKSSLQEEGIHSDVIPDELLATLTSTICPQIALGPLKLTKTPKDFKVCLQHRPDALWHQPAGRKKYKYFLDQPTSISGAGRDISFLCDACVYQKDRLHPPSMDEQDSALLHGDQKDMSPLETLIPEEYHIIKSKGLRGLQCYDDKFTVLLEDNEKKLRVFPSMKPTSRLEVMQLMKVMDDMLEKAGVNQDLQELSELSQMENLLELVRTEQNIYNIVFHEIIRQVSVECAERGQLLAKLRQRYAALLDRIPWQVKGLHSETLAQRAFDRRLTEEIMSFRNSVTKLNMELSMMKEHDECVSKEAEESKEELAKALEESQRNADIVAKYHDLYELQRRRLGGQMLHLSDERDLWRKATYSLAIKIIKINKLQLVKRLNVSEQTWAKTAEHFTLVLTTKDSEDVSHMIELTDQWKENLTTFMENLRKTEGSQRETIQSVRAHVVKWQKFCEDQFRSPDMKTIRSSEEELSYDLKQWSTVLTQQCERYGGEELVSSQETLEMLTNLQESWIEVCLRLFRRHPASDGGPPKGQEAMGELSKTITELHKQLRIRINGESGIHATLMSLSDNMEFWSRRLKSQSGPERHTSGDWGKMEEALGSLINLFEDAVLLVDSTQLERDRAKKLPHARIDIHDVLKTLKDFLFSQENFFDCEDMRLHEEVNSIHSKLIRWMVDLLLVMVPQVDSDDQASLPSPELNIIVDMSAEKLDKDASIISEKLDNLSKYITSSCQAIVEEEILKTLTQHDTENELHQLAKLQKECSDWVECCQVLLLDMKGSPVEMQLSVPQSVSEIALEDASMDSLLVLALLNVTLSPLQGEDQGVKAKDGSVIKLIGYDGNITEQVLGEETIQLTGTDELVVSPHTENAQQAFSALETVRSLQQELLEVESRAVTAEVRAIKAEEDLQVALDKIQDLEKQLQGLPHVDNKLNKKTGPPKTPSTPAVSSEPKTHQKAESSPKNTEGTKRH
ncbi:axonemal dynein light chain domain-containing protein 1 [Triplophysa dalaica]|uniref:axonemal dynein light chain domain-containing protein 1 n=1 Tax=Triplophysa dalaica TaxID=1582913 RepID=UPI0024DF7C87|nr:axonemal dynein light chain domain-containing protein 1 [Triplophysa dalaica]